MTAYLSTPQLEQRITFFTKLIGTILMIFGVVATIVQIVKLFLEGWNYSILIAASLGIGIFCLGRYSILNKIVRYSLFSGNLRIKRFIFTFPGLLVLLAIIIKIVLGHDSRTWKLINSEGGFIEYGTSLAYILAFIFALKIANYFRNNQSKNLATIYYFLAIFFLFIGLEEISWGQRLIGLESPDFFKSNNSQAEITIHNLYGIREYLHHAYILIGFLGSFSWMIFSKRVNDLSKYYLPSWFISSFFLPTFIFFIILEFSDGFGFFISRDQEPVEFLLSLGFLAFTMISFFRQAVDKLLNTSIGD